MKIIINADYGGFSLSEKAKKRLKELGCKSHIRKFRGKDYEDWDEIPRTDPFLIQVVKELGEDAHESRDNLEIVNIPDDVQNWYIEEYDGKEWIGEGRRWCRD